MQSSSCIRSDDTDDLRRTAMLTPRRALCVFVAACSMAVVACQPAEGPAERAGKSIDKTAKKVGDQADKTADKAREAVKDTSR